MKKNTEITINRLVQQRNKINGIENTARSDIFNIENKAKHESAQIRAVRAGNMDSLNSPLIRSKSKRGVKGRPKQITNRNLISL